MTPELKGDRTMEKSVTNAILQIANGIKKPSKVEAGDIILEMAKLAKLAESPTAIGNLAKLYAFFIPPQPKTAKTAMAWVARAVGNGPCKECLHYIYVTDQYMVATNNAILHLADNTENLEPGYYCPQTLKQIYGPDQCTFPEFSQLFPPPEKLSAVKKGCLVPYGKLTLQELVNINEEKIYVDLKILKISETPEYEILSVTGNKNAPIHLNTKYGKSLIMPVNYKP